LPDGTTTALAMKVAVTGGPARRFVVGDPNIQLIDILAGATLDRLAATEHYAGTGEVLLDGQTAVELEGMVHVVEWRGEGEAAGRLPTSAYAVVGRLTAAAPAPPPPARAPRALPEELVRPWVLPAVYERVRSGQGAFMAELRPAVALFLRFSGI